MDEKNTSPDELLDKFQNWYQPAADISACTDLLSTEEIVQALKQFDPSMEINPVLIFKFMTGMGFNYTPDPGKLTFQLKWMLIRKF
jgi:hypothetical protein